MDEKIYYLGFSIVPGIGPKRFNALLKQFGSAKLAWNANLSDFKKAGIGDSGFEKFYSFRQTFDFNLYLKKLDEKKVKYLALIDREYPQRLKEINSPPIVLFVKGDIKSLNYSNGIAVVGTRKMTSYGKEVTESLVGDLVSFGITIISGLALGIDAIAHKTAIETIPPAGGGKTIAVLGSGVDCCYPRENESLYEKIINGNGAVISPFPLSMQPSKGTFPARNEIISAISNGVLVTEAGEDSGSLITAEFGKNQEKPIFAVPGPITSRQSQGTAKLLKNGAVLIQNSKDIIDKLNIKSRVLENKKIEINNLNLSKKEKEILIILENESVGVDDLARKLKMKITDLSFILSSLEVQGFIKNSNGVFELFFRK